MAIVDIHEDIIRTHILTRLDGQTLAATGCTSSRLQSLCSDEKLWSNICSSNWPSTDQPMVKQAISKFTSGHFSFFSDSFPWPTHHLTTTTPPNSVSHIISSVDLKYKDELIFSKAESTNTTPSDWFKTSPFRIDLLEPKEVVPTSIMEFSGDDDDQVVLTNLENHVTLSWIIIDPTHNRAVNVSSLKPVCVQRNWLTSDIELTFSVVLKSHDNSYVNCNIQVTCGELYVSGVILTLQDMDGKCLSGKDSMVILQGLTVADRRCNDGGKGQKERYNEYMEMRRKRNEERERRERRLDMACVATGVGLLVAFWSFALC